MEIFGAGERLAEQFGADRLAARRDEAAIGLVREEELGEAGHAERIGEPGEERHENEEEDGGADLADHGVLLQTRPVAVMKRSISLMPANGMRMPPRP